MAGNKGSGRRHTLDQRGDKEQILRDLVLQNRTQPEIAKACGVNPATVWRWKSEIPEEKRLQIIADARRAAVENDAQEVNEERLDIARSYDRLAKRVEKIIEKFEDTDEDAFTLVAVEHLRKVLKDIATMHGKMGNVTVDIKLSESAEWIALKQIIQAVCDEVPEAREPFLRHMRHHVLSVTKQEGGPL